MAEAEAATPLVPNRTSLLTTAPPLLPPHLVDDAAHAARHLERRDGLLEVARLRPQARDEDGEAVAPERILQHARQLRLPVRHVAARAARQRDDALQGG